MPLMNDRRRFPVVAPQPHRHGRLLQTLPADPRLYARRWEQPAFQSFRDVVEFTLTHADANDLASPRTSEHVRSDSAKALAIRFWARGSAKDARAARAALLAANEGQWGGWAGTAEVVHNYVTAADLLRAAGRFSVRDMANLRERLTPKLVEGFSVAHDLPQNNWRIECDTSVALGALFFWHDPGAMDVREMLASSLDGISRMVHALVLPDGGYEEGQNYSRRAVIPVVRLAWAYWVMSGVDLLNEPQLRRWHHWQVLTKRPDGKMWPLDDGDDGYELYPHAMLCHRHYRHAAEQRWAYARAPLAKPEWAGEAMLLFDPTIKPRRPSGPASRVLADSGMAIFRSGWGADATMAVMVARPFSPFGSDQINTAHKHDDPTNFLLHSHGQLLVTEGGYGASYGSDARYHYFLAGAAHNMVLVDGQGPLRVTSHNTDSRHGNTSQSAGRVVELCRTPDLYGAQAITSYHNVDFRRSMFFVRNRYFVVIDQIESPRLHEYSWLLHGNSMDMREAHPDGAAWNVGPARVAAYNLMPSGLPWRHLKGSDTRQQGNPPRRGPGEHMYRRAWTSGRDMLMVSLIVPDPATAAMPKVAVASQSPVALRVRLDGMSSDDLFLWNPEGKSSLKVHGLGSFRCRQPAGVFALKTDG